MAAVLDKLPAMRVGDTDVTGIVRETLREVGDDDVGGLAAEMAYHSVLALFPFLLLIAGIVSAIDTVFGVPDLTARVVEQAEKTMPDDAVSLIESFTDEVVNSQGGFALGFGLIAALWASSSAMAVTMKALNRAYDLQEKRGWLKRRAVAIALTFVFGSLLLAAATLLLAGQATAGGIGSQLGWRDEFVLLWNIGTVPAAILAVVVAVAFLYWAAPYGPQPWKWLTPGALLFTVGWVAGSYAFATYLSHFSSYNRTYGSLSAVIILLMWLYWSNFLLLVGGELNAVLARREDEGEPARQRDDRVEAAV